MAKVQIKSEPIFIRFLILENPRSRDPRAHLDLTL